MNYFTKNWKWIVGITLGFWIVPQIALNYNEKFLGIGDKTLWDWLELLIIPLTIAGAGIFFTLVENDRGRRIAHQEFHTQLDIAQENQNEARFQRFIELILNLLLEENLANAGKDSAVAVIARSHTLAVGRLLDSERKGLMIRFLHEAGLISKGAAIIDLGGLYFQNTRFDLGDLKEVDLSGAFMPESYFPAMDISGSNLAGIVLGDSDLRGCDFANCDLSGAYLANCDLREVNFSGADLRYTFLLDAEFEGADLTGADLTASMMQEVQLGKAKKLDGATLPSKFNDRPYSHDASRLPNDD